MAATRTPTAREIKAQRSRVHGPGSAVLVLVLLVAPVLVAQSQPTRYRETIAGTLVSFEMVLVPGSGAQPSFYMGRTEVTWDLYDVYALGLDTGAP